MAHLVTCAMMSRSSGIGSYFPKLRPCTNQRTFMEELLPGQRLDSVTVCRHEKSLNIAGDTGGIEARKPDSCGIAGLQLKRYPRQRTRLSD
jgi:hypothetical protein